MTKKDEGLYNFDLLRFFASERRSVESKYLIKDNKFYALGDEDSLDTKYLVAIRTDKKHILVDGTNNPETNNESFADAQCYLQGNTGSVTTSFDCMRQAKIDIEKIEIIATSEDFTISAYSNSKDKDFKGFENKIVQGATYNVWRHGKKNAIYLKRWHRAGCVLLKFKNNYYICGQDEDSYFISKLPKKRTTIASAFKSLKPSRVIAWERKNELQAKRQGEWFFIPCPDMEADDMESNIALPHEDGGNEHRADRYKQAEDRRHYIDGYISHPEHTQLFLDSLHEAIKNTALGSWSVQGVD